MLDCAEKEGLIKDDEGLSLTAKFSDGKAVSDYAVQFGDIIHYQ